MTIADFVKVASKFMEVTIRDWDCFTYESEAIVPPTLVENIPLCLYDRNIIYMSIVGNIVCLRIAR